MELAADYFNEAARTLQQKFNSWRSNLARFLIEHIDIILFEILKSQKGRAAEFGFIGCKR